MPVVRISDEAYSEMERLRVGFETPNALIIRALAALRAAEQSALVAVPNSLAEKAKAADEASFLPQSAYRLPLLECMHELQGKARVADVRAAMERKLANRLGPGDRQLQPSGAAVRWWNLTMWTRKNLVDEGLFRGDSKHGWWELSDEGRAYLRKHVLEAVV